MTTLALIAGLVLAVLGAVAAAFRKGKSAGRADVAQEEAKANDQTRKEFDRIDRAPPDLDGALGRLRKRSTGSDSKPSAK